MRTRCLKCDEPHLTNDCPIKEKIANSICNNCNKTGHVANWSQCGEFPKIKQKKVESTLNRNTVKRIEANKTFKPVTTDIPFAAPIRGAQNENKKPGTLAPTEETPQINKIIVTKILLISKMRLSNLENFSSITLSSWKWADISEMQKATRGLISFINFSLIVMAKSHKTSSQVPNF
ncbi:hypothetical protein TNCV_3964301 [Trichonephila clavipes]|nr:hypothetical protein TNCV_3964301 [Trichonephila clavipes]